MVKQNRNNLSPEIGGNICLKLMFLFLAMIPFGFAYFTISHSLFSMYYEAGFITFLSVLILVTIGLIAVVMPEKMSKTKRIGALTAMFCASLIVRIFVINLLQTTPYSDFGPCYAYATGEQVADLDILINYPYLGAYAVLLKIVFAFFPVSVFTAQIVNSIATSCIPILLFLGTEKMTSKSRIAWVAGLTYAFYPGLIIYNAVTSCEHFSQFFFALGFYMLACERTSLTEQKRKRMIAYIGGAVAFGLMCLFKELFVILAPAILMMGFCYDVIPKIVRKVKEHLPNAGIIRSILKNVVFVLIVFCVYKCFVMAVQMEIGGTIVDRNDPISVPIYRGLTPSAMLTECVQMWDYLYIDDAVAGLTKLLTENHPGGIYNLGSGDCRPLRDYVEEMYRITGSHSALQYGAIPYPDTGAVNIHPDVSKMRSIGWTPSVSFEQGLRMIMRQKQYFAKDGAESTI